MRNLFLSQVRFISAGITAVFIIFCTGCSKLSPRETLFALGAPIQLGESTLTVSHSEVEQSSKSGNIVAVFFSLTGPGEISKAMIKLARSIKLKDGDGKTFTPDLSAITGIESDAPPFLAGLGGVIPADIYRAQKYNSKESLSRLLHGIGSGSFTEWVVCFTTPIDSNKLSLVIKNYDKKKGQPTVAIIQLGR